MSKRCGTKWDVRAHDQLGRAPRSGPEMNPRRITDLNVNLKVAKCPGKSTGGGLRDPAQAKICRLAHHGPDPREQNRLIRVDQRFTANSPKDAVKKESHRGRRFPQGINVKGACTQNTHRSLQTPQQGNDSFHNGQDSEQTLHHRRSLGSKRAHEEQPNIASHRGDTEPPGDTTARLLESSTSTHLHP